MIHTHYCLHCEQHWRCLSVDCDVHDRDNVTCPDCYAPIAEVDALPNPERGPLALASIERVVARATRAALEKAARHPEEAPAVFAAHVDALAPHDSTRQDPDTWSRIGVLLGSKAAWSGSCSLALPPDCPPGAAARCFIGAWSFAAGVVMQIRMEVGHGK